MRAAIAGLVLCVVALGAVARADEASDREEARREFALGQAADRQRDWQSAIEHYLRANDLVPHPNAMFNIATDYDRLGKPREAAIWYQRYVEAAPDSPDRDRVIRLLRDLAVRPGLLTVTSTPPGARVTIDGADAGITPVSKQVKGGAHRVAVEHEGQVEQRDVRIEYGEPATVDIVLRGPSGTLRVVGTPPGAQVVVDETPSGSIPTAVTLPAGPHAVRVSAYGYTTFATSATIEPNRETVLEAKLVRVTGGDTGRLQAGYMLGAGGGADLAGSGAAFHFELGARFAVLELYSRFGKTGGLSALEFGLRWAFATAKLTPYLGLGYGIVTSVDDDSTAGGNSGYALSGGLKLDVSRGERATFSVLVESGIRYYSGLSDSDTDPTTDGGSGLIVPLMATLQVLYR